ncbi:MAG: NAD(P)H-binding protein [Allosphingosinicella sp.]
MKIIVTGASGQYGRRAVAGLLGRVLAEDLILLTRRPEKLADLAALGANVRRGDFDDPASLVEAFQSGERMLLISATRVGKRVVQHKAAIDAAATAGVRHVAYTSVVGIGPGNPAVVTRDHGPTEQLMRDSGMAWTALRDSQYADAVVQAMAPNAVATGRWLSSSGDGRIAVVARDDCVACAVEVLTGSGHENRVYDITGPELVTYREAAAMAAEVAGAAIDYVATDDAGMYAMFDALGIPREPVDDQIVAGIPWNSDDMVTFEAAVREGWFAVISDDVERLTGRAPNGLRAMFGENADLLRAAAAARG